MDIPPKIIPDIYLTDSPIMMILVSTNHKTILEVENMLNVFPTKFIAGALSLAIVAPTAYFGHVVMGFFLRDGDCFHLLLNTFHFRFCFFI